MCPTVRGCGRSPAVVVLPRSQACRAAAAAAAATIAIAAVAVATVTGVRCGALLAAALGAAGARWWAWRFGGGVPDKSCAYPPFFAAVCLCGWCFHGCVRTARLLPPVATSSFPPQAAKCLSIEGH